MCSHCCHPWAHGRRAITLTINSSTSRTLKRHGSIVHEQLLILSLSDVMWRAAGGLFLPLTRHALWIVQKKCAKGPLQSELTGVCVRVASGNMHQWRLTSKKTHGYKNAAAWQLDPFLLKWNSSRNPKKQSTYSVKYCKHQMAIFRNQHMNQPTIDHIYNLQEKQWITKHISKQFRMNIQI